MPDAPIVLQIQWIYFSNHILISMGWDLTLNKIKFMKYGM